MEIRNSDKLPINEIEFAIGILISNNGIPLLEIQIPLLKIQSHQLEVYQNFEFPDIIRNDRVAAMYHL